MKPYCYIGPSRIGAGLLLAGFPDVPGIITTMVAIHGGETSGNVWAIGGPNKDGSYDYGAFQINVPAGKQPPPSWDNYIVNATLALPLYKVQGYKAWYGRKNIDKPAGLKTNPTMTWRQWAKAGVDEMYRKRAAGKSLEVLASFYYPMDGMP
jgi:hypothetical protein